MLSTLVYRLVITNYVQYTHYIVISIDWFMVKK